MPSLWESRNVRDDTLMDYVISTMADIRRALNNLPKQDWVYFEDSVSNTFR